MRAPPPILSDYPYTRLIATRWKDNDIYGHVNNAEYYSYFDTVINTYLINAGGLDIHHSEVIAVCVQSSCGFFDSLAFPENILAAMSVDRIGRTSVTYNVALFHAGNGEGAAQGAFTHVFVDRATRKPQPIPPSLKGALVLISSETPS